MVSQGEKDERMRTRNENNPGLFHRSRNLILIFVWKQVDVRCKKTEVRPSVPYRMWWACCIRQKGLFNARGNRWNLEDGWTLWFDGAGCPEWWKWLVWWIVFDLFCSYWYWFALLPFCYYVFYFQAIPSLFEFFFAILHFFHYRFSNHFIGL